MERDQSNDEARSREPVTESPAQEYFLPNHQNGLKLKSDVSKQGFPGDEPPSETSAQEHLVSKSQEGLELEFDVSNERGRGDKPPSEPPAHKHLVSKSPGGHDSSVATAVQTVIDHGDDQTAVSLPPSTTFRPVNMVLEERSYSPQPNGLVQDLGEQRPTNGRPESQQPQLGNLNKSSGNSWQANDVAQTWDSAARDSSSVNDQRREESEVTHSKDDLSVGQFALDQGSRNNGPSTTFDTRPPGGSVLSSMQTTQMRATSEVKHQQDESRASQAVLDQAPPNKAPGTTFDKQSRKAFPPSQVTAPLSSEIPSSHRNQERLPVTDNISLPPNAVHVKPRVCRWNSQREYSWVGFLPDINESRRFESQAPKGQPRRLIQGPSQPLGPPLKPLDGPICEAKAQERWRRDHE